MLVGDERLDYLLAENLRIIQSPSVFSFSLDAVLLARFASIPLKENRKIVDLCSGNGVIPLFLSARTKSKIIGVELQERLVDMARRSITYNKLEHQIEMVHANVIGIAHQLGVEQYDAVLCNPPYFEKHEKSIKNENIHLALARHEIELTLEQAIQSASQLLKQGGKAVFVHRPSRLADFIELMRKYRLEPKRIQLVHPKEGKEANILLIEAIKDGKKDLKVEAPYFVYDDVGEYTKELKVLLFGKE